MWSTTSEGTDLARLLKNLSKIFCHQLLGSWNNDLFTYLWRCTIHVWTICCTTSCGFHSLLSGLFRSWICFTRSSPQAFTCGLHPLTRIAERPLLSMNLNSTFCLVTISTVSHKPVHMDWNASRISWLWYICATVMPKIQSWVNVKFSGSRKKVVNIHIFNWESHTTTSYSFHFPKTYLYMLSCRVACAEWMGAVREGSMVMIRSTPSQEDTPWIYLASGGRFSQFNLWQYRVPEVWIISFDKNKENLRPYLWCQSHGGFVCFLSCGWFYADFMEWPEQDQSLQVFFDQKSPLCWGLVEHKL